MQTTKTLRRFVQIMVVGLLLGTALNSCFVGCKIMVSGTVVDALTNEPLDSVRILVYNDDAYESEIFTGANGIFHASMVDGHSVFITAHCKELRMEFSRTGYQSTTYARMEPETGTVIRMSR